MKEVTQLLRRKGQRLINELQNSNMFARIDIEKGVSEQKEAVLNGKIHARNEAIKLIRDTFEIEEGGGSIIWMDGLLRC